MAGHFLPVLCSLLALQGLVHSQDWIFSGENGPEFWTDLPGGELCGGSMQSPIDIQSKSVVLKEFETFIGTGWEQARLDGPHPRSIVNDGRVVRLDLEGDYLVSGGGLPVTYKGFRVGVHIGANSSRGSEHTVDGKQYPGEVHVPLFDYMKYDTFQEALPEPGGLHILGWFIEEGDHNPGWDPYLEALSNVKYAGSSYEFETPFVVANLFPPTFFKFWRYDGSIPSPPCVETIGWTIYQDTIKLSPEQIDAFRQLSRLSEEPLDDQELPLVDNFRPVQPVGDRTVYSGYILYDTCEGRCYERAFDVNYPCQCNSACRQHGDCCEDYKDNCLVEVCSYVHTYKNKMRKQPRETEMRGDE